MHAERHGPILLVDAGNSRIKWRLGESATQHGAIDPDAADSALLAQLVAAWQNLPALHGAWVASVAAPRIDRLLQRAMARQLGVEPSFVRSPPQALGVINAYRHPAQLGVDRFLAMVAAHHAQPGAQLLVSVGTALTVDALGADGRHLGGLIAATPQLARRALLANTARIVVADGQMSTLADNTADAVAAGTRVAALGVIDHARRALREYAGSEPRIIISGGGMDELLPHLPLAQARAGLVLDGLALWAGQQDADTGAMPAAQPR